MRSVAVRLAAGTLATFFGDVPEWWEGITLEHAELMWGSPQTTSGHLEHLVGFQEHVWELIGERRASPRDDVISRLARDGGAAAPGLRLAELQTHMVQSAFSNSNVIRLLGVVARTLAGRPDLRERLRAEPARVDDFVSEVLRTSPPLRGVFRRTARACTAGELDVPAGGGLFVSLSRANRDAGRFPAPAALDVGRDRARTHLAFGAGIHWCPAAPLATMQAAVVARALCDLPWLRPVEAGFEDCSHGLFAGPSELWLELAPA
jgi:cytochrome P450